MHKNREYHTKIAQNITDKANIDCAKIVVLILYNLDFLKKIALKFH